ncbi:MAG: hypothetical protein AABW51_01625 [Nanoarchaeota archaeon]
MTEYEVGDRIPNDILFTDKQNVWGEVKYLGEDGQTRIRGGDYQTHQFDNPVEIKKRKDGKLVMIVTPLARSGELLD